MTQPLDECLGRNGLRTIAATIQYAEMGITRDDEVRVRGDGAIGEFVVVPVGGNGAKGKRRRDADDGPGVNFCQFQKPFERLPPGGTGCPDDDFAIFKQDIGGERPGEPPGVLGIEDEGEGVALIESLQHHVGIQHGDHALRFCRSARASLMISSSRENFPSAQSRVNPSRSSFQSRSISNRARSLSTSSSSSAGSASIHSWSTGRFCSAEYEVGSLMWGI
jgi:hypothetical protein